MNTLKEVKAAHDEYDRLTGKVVHRFETTHYDPETKLFYKRTTEYIDIGRPDPVTPASEDDALKREKMWHEPRVNIVEQEAIAILREHGPLTATQMSKFCNRHPDILRNEMDRKPQTFTRLGIANSRSRAQIWGLVGVHDKAAA